MAGVDNMCSGTTGAPKAASVRVSGSFRLGFRAQRVPADAFQYSE